MAETSAESSRPEPAGSTDSASATMVMPVIAAFGLGALAAACWLAALLLDFQTTRLPGWAREAPHAALVLAVPALVILMSQLRGDLHWSATLLALLVAIVASLPGLLLVSQVQDLASLPLRIPTLGLGVALGYTSPFERAAYGTERRGRAAAASGFGFTLLLAPVAFVLVTTANTATPLCPPPPAQIDCGAASGAAMALGIATCGTTLLTLLLALGTAALGGVIGRGVGRLGR